MKSLYESLLDIDDTINSNDAIISNFLKDNYTFHTSTQPEYTIKDGIVNVNGSCEVKNKSLKSLTNGIFKFGKVDGYFDCSNCTKLKSLEGAPEFCSNSFYCNVCHSLKDLKGAPEKIGDDFDCSGCAKLETLEGASKEIGGSFYCNNCQSLRDFKKGPKKINGAFEIMHCPKIKANRDYIEKFINAKGGVITW